MGLEEYFRETGSGTYPPHWDHNRLTVVLKSDYTKRVTPLFFYILYSHGGPMDWDQEIKDQEEEQLLYGKYAELFDDASAVCIEIEYCTSY